MMKGDENTALSVEDQADFKKDIITSAKAVMGSLINSTVENSFTSLFDAKKGMSIPIKENLDFLKKTALREMSIKEPDETRPVFLIENTTTKESIEFSNRDTRNGELRGKRLREALENERKKNDQITIYDAISNILKNIETNDLFIASKNILVQAYTRGANKDTISVDVLNFMQLLKKESETVNFQEINYEKIYNQVFGNFRYQPTLLETDSNNTFWSRFKENWRAGTILRDTQRDSADASFYGHLFVPMVAAMLLPLQVFLYPILKASEKKSWLTQAAGAVGAITYGLAFTALMFPVIALAEPINLIVAAATAVFKKEPLDSDFYLRHGKFGGNRSEDNNGTIYSGGLSIGASIWNFPAKLYSLLKKKESPKVPISQPEQQQMIQLPAYKQFEASYPTTDLSLVKLDSKTTISSKTLFFRYKKNNPEENTLLRQQTIEAYLLFLHSLATQKNPRSTIDVTAVQHSPNESLLSFKTEALSQAIIAYQNVNPNIHFTLNGETPTSTLGPTEKTIAFCEELKKPAITPSLSVRK